MRTIPSVVFLIVLGGFPNGFAFPTTTELPSETTVVDIIYETTTNAKDAEAVSEDSLNDNVLNFETTTEDNQLEETTIISQEPPTKTQQDVVQELHGLWNLSESLDETQSDLKSSLTSIVHLAYARVETEPEETLDRLKNLLRTLRSRLSRTATPEVGRSKVKRSLSRSLLQGFENLVTSAAYNVDYRIPEEQVASTGTPQTNPTVPPGEATIQKVIHVLGEPQPEPPQPLSPLSSSTLIQTNVLMNNETGNLPSAVTAEHIANAILKLLHSNTLPFVESMYADKVQFSERIPEVANLTLETTTTNSPLLPDFDSSENEIMERPYASISSTSSEVVRSTTNEKISDSNDLLNNSDMELPSPSSSENYNSMEFAVTVSVKPPGKANHTGMTSSIINMFDELTANNIMMGPILFLNGTREGMVQFIQTFNILSFKTKMAILFALSISILSIALGIYSLGPPIIVVGALGILIPISLLYALQSQERREFNKKHGLSVPDPFVEIENTLTNLLKAIEKYNM